MAHAHARRAGTLALLLALAGLGACATTDREGKPRWDEGSTTDPNGVRDPDDHDGRDGDRDGHDQDWE